MSGSSPPAPVRVLVADDQPDVREALRILLKGEGFEIRTAQSPAGVLHEVETGEFDVVLMDLNYTRDTTSGAEGLDLLPRIRELDRTLPVVVMTACCGLRRMGVSPAMMGRSSRTSLQKTDWVVM